LQTRLSLVSELEFYEFALIFQWVNDEMSTDPSNTKTLSSICRQLAFAEGGICWFYLHGCNFPIEIKLILTFLLFFFIADASQYYYLAINNKKQAEFYEDLLNRKIITAKEQVQRPIKINSSGNFCFLLKLFSIAIASLLLVAKFYCP
jgi:hypothetical protein